MFVLFVKIRNQTELLRLNLAHHLGWGFDHVIIADNESDDATQDMLRGFGDAITVTRVKNPNDWGLALCTLLERIEKRYRSTGWVAVSDTDEFWWTPDYDLRSLLADVADDVVAVNSDQKLFLPTELDPPAGPVYCRRTFRTTGKRSPLHTSYLGGKSLYRFSWLRDQRLTNPHWSENIPHAFIRLPQRLVHHYMIDGEDCFVAKVTSQERWGPVIRGEPATDIAQEEPTTTVQKSLSFRAFRLAWWRLYEDAGEAGLRDYYRREYVITADKLPAHLRLGELVQDAQFATFKRSNPD